MFKMNPAAKEFVPAHILKKRQEDAALGEITQKLDKVDIKPHDNNEAVKTSKDENHKSEINKDRQDNYTNDEDDRYLLNAGENLCEFNGEQFIIPGDDVEDEDDHDHDDEPGYQPGYDFGNAEDNEDEDVCNAFEEFLGNLPD